jgi:hypothetical protein
MRMLSFAAGAWLATCGLCLQAHGAVRQSAAYAIATETCASGGAAASANYSLTAAVQDCVGVSSNTAAGELLRHGFIGQLYDVDSVLVTAAPASVNEGATCQTYVAARLDDGTVLALAGSDAAWSVAGWPLAGVGAGGLVTAATVYAHTSGVVCARYAAVDGTLRLTVFDVDKDNFGSYAADGLDDDWQVAWFGLNNPNAAPTADADRDLQDNRYEWTTGTDPTDGASRFRFWMQMVTGHPTHRDLCSTPLRPGRSYMLESRTSLQSGDWDDQTCTIRDDGEQRTFTDTDATAPAKFYRLKISYP